MSRLAELAAHRAYVWFVQFAPLAAAALLFTSVASAQPSTTTLGVYAGGTSSAYHGSDTPGPTHIGGFVAGLWTDWSLAPHWSVQSALEFVQKGSNQTDFVGGGYLSEHIRMSYVEIPVLLRASAKTMGDFTPWIAAGLHVAFKAACSLSVSGSTQYSSCSQLVTTGNTPTQPAVTESMDYGASGAAGVDFTVGGRAMTLSARYDHGFANVFKGQDVKNRSLAFQLGYRIR